MNTTQIDNAIVNAHTTFLSWQKTSTASKESLLLKLAQILIENKQELAQLITQEVGTPISQSTAEVEKCALMCQVYEGQIDKCLCDERINASSYIKYEPMGVIFSIAPWNFPFWMSLRFIVPTIMAGNSVVFKHASNVPKSAQAVHTLFTQAGFSENLVTWLPIKAEMAQHVIANKLVRGVNFAGGIEAGSSVASLAGKYIKKSVLELGGSDAAIVCEDVNVEQVASTLVKARLRNAGQACNSPKRILVHQSIYTQFIEAAQTVVKDFVPADPKLESTSLGPLISDQAVTTAINQVAASVKLGATLVNEIKQDGRFLSPIIVTNIASGMPVFDEEVFAPVIAIGKFDDITEVIALANHSDYGLGASVWTNNVAQANQIMAQLEAGNVFLNSPIRSDPRMPFGGVKDSGYGKELGRAGMLEFTNAKVVVTA